MSAKRRVLALGLDGLSHSLIREFCDTGGMPNFAALCARQPLIQTDSVLPTVSSVAWSCLATAKNPGKFGVFGFSELTRDLDLRIPDSRDLRTPTIWEVLAGAGKRVAALGVPLTHPPRSIPQGMLVSCFLADSLGLAEVVPPSRLRFLMENGYRTDTDPTVAWEDRDRFVRDLHEVLRGRRRTLRALLQEDAWDFLLMHVMDTDRICHFLLKDYRDGREPYAGLFTEFFRAVDGMVGEAAELLPADAALMILSDHGFCPVRREVQLNRWLSREGYLAVGGEIESLGFRAIQPGSRAFALVPGRIHLLTADRFAAGGVPAAEVETLTAELSAKLAALRDPDTGESMVRGVFRGSDLFHGPHAARGPDLLLDPMDGYDLKAALSPGELFTRSPVTGMHTVYDAHLWFSEPLSLEGKPMITDVPRVVFDVLGVPLPADADSRGVCLAAEPRGGTSA